MDVSKFNAAITAHDYLMARAFDIWNGDGAASHNDALVQAQSLWIATRILDTPAQKKKVPMRTFSQTDQSGQTRSARSQATGPALAVIGLARWRGAVRAPWPWCSLPTPASSRRLAVPSGRRYCGWAPYWRGYFVAMTLTTYRAAMATMPSTIGASRAIESQ